MNDYKVTINVTADDYEKWKEFLKSKNIALTGKHGNLINVNAMTFGSAINKIMCADIGCEHCHTCDYDHELKDVGIL